MTAFFLRLSRLLVPLFAAGASLLWLPFVRASTFDLKIIHTFTAASDGNVPYPALVQGADGKLYGTNSTGGKNAVGTVFALDLDGGHFDVLSAFPGTGGGTAPQGGLVQARDGNFYGTTHTGGSNGYGVIYQVTPGGALTYLDSFNNGAPGASPVGTMIEGIDGYLYGTAEFGGKDNYGTIYRAALPGSTLTTTLTTFAEVTGGLAGTYPESDLIQGLDGNFYGTTATGGSSTNGTFFQVTTAGVYSVLYNFGGGGDGATPLRGVVQGADGYFYGTTTTGGTYASGTIYRISPSSTDELQVLHTFNPNIAEGATPDGGLFQATDGNFYGTTAFGGASLAGTIYVVTPTGGYATLYSFSAGTDGGYPVGGLTEGNDGKLYGTTAGENGSSGTVFQLDLGLPPPAPQASYPLVLTAAVGDTVLIKGNYFVGATGVSFTAANNTRVASANVNVLSKTIVSAVVPDAAATGPIIVTNAIGSSATIIPLTVTGTVAPTPTPTPTPPATPTVSIVANDAVATRAGGNNGIIKIVRHGDKTSELTIPFKTQGTAVRGTDYNLVTSGETLATVTRSVTIPAGVTKVKIKLVPVSSTAATPDETAVIKLKPGTGYELESPGKAVVQIAGSTGG